MRGSLHSEKKWELHFIIASIPIFSEKWVRIKKIFDIITDYPIATGPYKIKRLNLEKIWFEKRFDYWVNNHPVRKNQFNFSTISLGITRTFARLGHSKLVNWFYS